MTYGGVTKRTPTRLNTTDPDWSTRLVFPLVSSEERSVGSQRRMSPLRVRVMDWSPLGEPRCIGAASQTVDLARLRAAAERAAAARPGDRARGRRRRRPRPRAVHAAAAGHARRRAEFQSRRRRRRGHERTSERSWSPRFQGVRRPVRVRRRLPHRRSLAGGRIRRGGRLSRSRGRRFGGGFRGRLRRFRRAGNGRRNEIRSGRIRNDEIRSSDRSFCYRIDTSGRKRLASSNGRRVRPERGRVGRARRRRRVWCVWRRFSAGPARARRPRRFTRP